MGVTVKTRQVSSKERSEGFRVANKELVVEPDQGNGAYNKTRLQYLKIWREG